MYHRNYHENNEIQDLKIVESFTNVKNMYNKSGNVVVFLFKIELYYTFSRCTGLNSEQKLKK